MIPLLLAEFVTTAIPDNSLIRELLSTRRSQVTKQDIARFRFCLHIVYYLLACMALKTSFADETVAGSFVDELQDHLRAYFDSDHVKVRFADYIVLPSERDKFLSMLRNQLERKDAAIDVGAFTTTRLTLFDSVANKRLGDYSDAMRRTEHRFHSIAALMITSHFGANDLPSVPPWVLAKVFSDSYDTAVKMIAHVKGSVPTKQPWWKVWGK